MMSCVALKIPQFKETLPTLVKVVKAKCIKSQGKRARVRGNFVVMLPHFLPSQVPKLKSQNSITNLVLWQITFTLL